VTADPTLAAALVTQAARLVRTVRADMDLPAGFRVLSMLDEHGPLGVTRLAVLDGTSQPTMSGTVAAVLERGWVDKQPHPDDARTAVVSLTDAGRAELLRGRARIGDQVARRLAATSHTEQDVAAAVDLLRSLLGKDEQ
jgi:DNA-binding MarR family transcriptional regulator